MARSGLGRGLDSMLGGGVNNKSTQTKSTKSAVKTTAKKTATKSTTKTTSKAEPKTAAKKTTSSKSTKAEDTKTTAKKSTTTKATSKTASKSSTKKTASKATASSKAVTKKAESKTATKATAKTTSAKAAAKTTAKAEPKVETKKAEVKIVENETGIINKEVVSSNLNKTTLRVSEIEPNRSQPRKFFNEEALKELAESLKTHGMIEPIVVKERDGYYEIIAGERRWRAAKKAGLKEIPAIVREDDDKTNKQISLIENIQRENLNAVEKAYGIRALMDEYNLTQEEIAKQGKLTEGHCKALLAIQDPEEQIKTALRIVENGDTVRSTEKKVQHKKNNSKIARKYDYVYKDIEDTFQGFFGTKVKVDAGKRSGKIIINYTNNDDLERILSLIKN